MSSDHRRSSPTRVTKWLRGRQHRAHLPPRRQLYAGHRDDRGQVFVVTRTGLAPLSGRSHPGYDWGADNTGAVRLAHALLADLLGREVPADLAAALAAGPLTGLPHDGFVLDARDLLRWLDRVSPVRPDLRSPLWLGNPFIP